MLHRDACGVQDILQRWNIQPEDSHAECKQDSRKEKQILRAFVEGGWMIEYRPTAGADGHQIEPLPWEC